MVRMTGKPHGFDITISDPVKRIQRFIDIYVNDESYKVPSWNRFRPTELGQVLD